jgi:uncharacterized protein (TIGR00369 family)
MNAPADPQFVARIRSSFARQNAMALIGARLGLVAPGAVEIVLPFRDELTQQKGYVHGGIIGMVADSAAGYAAYTLMPADSTLVTSEYKINLLASATSGLVARGEVVKAGRTLTVARAEVYADDRTHIATMQQTLMMLPGRTDQRE